VFRRWCENEAMATKRWREVWREEERRGKEEGDSERKGNGEGGRLVWPVEGMGVRRSGGRGSEKKRKGEEEKKDYEKDEMGKGVLNAS